MVQARDPPKEYRRDVSRATAQGQRSSRPRAGVQLRLEAAASSDYTSMRQRLKKADCSLRGFGMASLTCYDAAMDPGQGSSGGRWRRVSVPSACHAAATLQTGLRATRGAPRGARPCRCPGVPTRPAHAAVQRVRGISSRRRHRRLAVFAGGLAVFGGRRRRRRRRAEEEEEEEEEEASV
ncbi:unnamed protein product [Prorocentrum cordatum]|uniref:Uncharacterized protein n=1 Tax=Prorocentrum cordatum TaxID=2364126 RepID=A0ABN9PW79_9DINO|nr:unnamed protein product [Polarella glacialis]